MALKIKINGQKVSAMFTVLIYTCSEYTDKIIQYIVISLAATKKKKNW